MTLDNIYNLLQIWFVAWVAFRMLELFFGQYRRIMSLFCKR